MVLIPFLDISRKYYFSEVIPYMLENKLKKQMQKEDKQGEKEQFQGTRRSKQKQFPTFAHMLLIKNK